MTTRDRDRKAATLFRSGLFKRPYKIRKDIVKGVTSDSAVTESGSGTCSACNSLIDLKEACQSLVHSGRDLRRRRTINHLSKAKVTTNKQKRCCSLCDGKGHISKAKKLTILKNSVLLQLNVLNKTNRKLTTFKV